MSEPAAAPAVVLTKEEKASLKEGGKKGIDLQGVNEMGGVQFFNLAVESADGKFSLLEKVMEGANQLVDEAEEERKGGAGHIGKLFASAGDDQLAIMIHVPTDISTKLSVQEWVDAVVKAVGAKVEGVEGEFAKLSVAADPAAGKFPLKLRDEVIAAGLALLKEKGLIPANDDSDDDVNYAEAAGVEW